MGNNSHKPAIRFQGFTDAWEQRKLSDEFKEFIVPMRDKPKEFGGSIPWTRIEDIEGKYLNGTLSDQNVTEETVMKMNLKIIPKDSLIVSSSATFGVVAVVTQDLITNQTFIGLVPNDKDTLDYWYSYFQSDEARRYMKLQSAGSTIFYISRESFENMPITLPSKEETIKIGELFTNLDNIITLHQRKYEKLLTVKKSMLEKMFPRDGSNNPEIRFIGFTDPWEQRKLGDIADTKTGPFGTQLSAKEYTASGIPVINVKNIGTGCIQENDLDYVSESTAKRLSDHIIQENDIVFGRKGAIGRHAIIGKTQNNWVQGSDCIRVRFKPGIVASYVNAQLQTANVIDHLSMNAYGSTMLTLTTDMINSIPLLMPEEAEQSEIAHVFSDIDNLITLHHLKLEKLKNIKQSLLQNMFV